MLYRSEQCDAYWAGVIFSGNLKANSWAIATLRRYYPDADPAGVWNCDSGGGDGHVIPGDNACHTPMVYAPSHQVTFRAEGKMYLIDTSGRSVLFLFGETNRTR